jgi:dTDP-4-dehydrorhamnose 3,5-epimerase
MGSGCFDAGPPRSCNVRVVGRSPTPTGYPARPMRALPTSLEDVLLIEPPVHGDERGFFVETFRAGVWGELGVDVDFVQDNHSRSRRGTLRGMHFQTHPGQAKLVRCARGRILDVVVDLRRGSETFGRWDAHELDDVALRQLWVPVGFAHGFCVLSDEADVVYKCSSYYDPATEAGIAFDDPDVGIEWPEIELTVSDRDRTAPRLAQIADGLPFVSARA